MAILSSSEAPKLLPSAVCQDRRSVTRRHIMEMIAVWLVVFTNCVLVIFAQDLPSVYSYSFETSAPCESGSDDELYGKAKCNVAQTRHSSAVASGAPFGGGSCSSGSSGASKGKGPADRGFELNEGAGGGGRHGMAGLAQLRFNGAAELVGEKLPQTFVLDPAVCREVYVGRFGGLLPSP